MLTAATKRTSRSHERFRVRCWLVISVNSRKLPARAIELSGAGATAQSLFPIAVGAHVRVRSRVHLLSGSACVCSCRRRGLVYWIGLEFSKPLSARF